MFLLALLLLLLLLFRCLWLVLLTCIFDILMFRRVVEQFDLLTRESPPVPEQLIQIATSCLEFYIQVKKKSAGKFTTKKLHAL